VDSNPFEYRKGEARWSPVANVTADYKIDIRDIAAIAKKSGWTG
jgi:hypothetical protein